MSASSSSSRSTLIDHTYEDICFLLSGHREGLRTEQTVQILDARIEKLKRVWEPFETPSESSQKALESGSLNLSDGTTIKVDKTTKELALAISEQFNIDQVDSYVLLRSFLYNDGMIGGFPDNVSRAELVQDIIAKITPFYYSERTHAARTLIALLKCQQTVNDPFCDNARKLLPKVILDPPQFAEKLISEYRRKAQLPIPAKSSTNPRHASAWAKQNAKEQLVLIEILFWLLWDYATVTAPTCLMVFTAAYETDFGHRQANATSLLDAEGSQLKRDVATLWVFLTIEVLNLEYLPETLSILPERVDEKGQLYAAPETLAKIHTLIMNHVAPGFVCTMVAWALFIRAISQAATKMGPTRPHAYAEFLKEIRCSLEVTFRKGEHEVADTLLSTCLTPEAGLFPFMTDLLFSPLLLSSSALKAASAVTDPGDIAYRALLKGLVICIIDAQKVETMPDFEGLVETWIALFGGNEETPHCAGLCRQYWDVDWRISKDRRALLDVARSRFPVQFRPLVRILRSLTGSMRLENSDPDIGDLSNYGSSAQDRLESSKYVHFYFAKLPTYTQILPPAMRTGANVLYDRVVDRTGYSRASGGTAYTNLRQLNLPGGTTIPAKCVGRLLSSDSSHDNVVVAWQHEHSGWKLVVDVLLDYVYRRQGISRGIRHTDAAYGRRGDAPVTLSVSDIGIEDNENEALVADGLELILSIVQSNAPLTVLLMQSLEEGGPLVSHSARDVAPPDLVQLIFMILEDVLGRAHNNRAPVPSALIAPCLGILTTLLSLPNYSNRVWLFLRSSPILFGSDRDATYNSPILTSERNSGTYVMTLSLLRLVRTLLEESTSRLVPTHAEQPKLQMIKEEVLLRAVHFIQTHIWVEHAGWRYAHLPDRFEISRSVVELYARILDLRAVLEVNGDHTPRSVLVGFVSGVFITHAANPTITPLVHAIASARTVISALNQARRIPELHAYRELLEKALRLTRLILQLKNTSQDAFKGQALLEQALCADHAAANMLLRASRSFAPDLSSRANPVDVLMHLIGQRELGTTIPIESTKVLTALCMAFADNTSPDARPSLLSYLSDAHATMAGLVRILKHPYDDLDLRNALWGFVTTAVQIQAPLAVLFVAGQFRVQATNAKGKAKEGAAREDDLSAIGTSSSTKSASAVDAACTTLSGWKDLWESNPQLLASVLGFLEVVWSRSLENLLSLEPSKGDDQFWKNIAAIVREELGPAPDYISSKEQEEDGEMHSDLHSAVQYHAYKTTVKAHALSILGADIAVHLQSAKGDDAKTLPASYKEIASLFENEELFRDSISETISSSYDSELFDRLTIGLSSMAPISLPSLMFREPLGHQQFGDGFMLSIPLLLAVLRSSLAGNTHMRASAENIKLLVFSANQNMSLAHSQLSMMRAWGLLLGQVRGHLRNSAKARSILLSAAALASQDIAKESRSGDFMATIHGARLQLLLALLEAAWYTNSDSPQQVKDFMNVLNNVGVIISSETFPPGRSFLGLVPDAFHRSLLLIIYFCAKKCQYLDMGSQIIRAEYRLLMGKVFTSSLTLVIDALRLAFDTARTRQDVDLDKDLDLLVAVFQQCTRKGLHSSSTTWLTRCQEADVFSASLMLLCQTDMSGLSDLELLRSRGRPLYTPQVLAFHMALASIPFTAERLASEGAIAAYSNNSISVALSEGIVAPTLPELPSERSPAHKAYCAMLANVTGMISNLASPQQFIESQVIGFVQLYGLQITKALSWTNDDPLTLPFLEELELSVKLFYLMAPGNVSGSSRNDTALAPVLRAFTEVALLLVQQLNYALTHPKHLTGILEPITVEERIRMEHESSENVSVANLTDLLDAAKRPIMASVIYRLFSLAANVLNTLSIIGGAETVLLSDTEEWPTKEAVVVPHSKVKMGEPASIGTLIELGSCSLETFQFLTNKRRSAFPTQPPPTTTSEKPASPDAITDIMRSTQQTLETALVYASTQLVLWLSKNDVEQDAIEADEVQNQSVGPGADGHGYVNKADLGMSGAKERRLRRKSQSLTLAERLRRGMTGEMTMDLQTLVSKAKVAVARGTESLEKADSVDIFGVLQSFLEDRMQSAS